MAEFFEHYLELLSDPAHLAVEITIMLVVDVIFLGLIWPLVMKIVNKKIAKAHRELDKEHGVDHAKATNPQKKQKED